MVLAGIMGLALSAGAASAADAVFSTNDGTVSGYGFNGLNTNTLALGNNWTLTYTPVVGKNAFSGNNIDLGSFSLNQLPPGSGTGTASGSFTLLIDQTAPAGLLPPTSASITGTVSQALGSNVVVLTFSPSAVSVIAGIDLYKYSIPTQTDPNGIINGGLAYSVSISSDGTPATLNGAFLKVPGAALPLPNAVLGGMGLLGLLALGKLRRQAA